MDPSSQSVVIARTRHWLERAVIGLNLCPFAKTAHVKGHIHYAVSSAADWAPLLAELHSEMEDLLASSQAKRETTLLIVSHGLADFFEFNGFLAQAQRELVQAGHEGVLQIAAFHPRWEFAGADADDIGNYTNRAPYPTLHLLREGSVAQAARAFPDAAPIYDANIATLRRLGHAGWQAWMQETEQ